jgi:four helix bundle protein
MSQYVPGQRPNPQGTAARGRNPAGSRRWENRAPNKTPPSDDSSGAPPEHRGHKDLIVWQKAMELATAVYQLTKKLPNDERYALSGQLRAAAVAVPAAVAAGHARHDDAQFVCQLAVAQAHLAEIDTLLLLATGLGYLTDADVEPAATLQVAVRQLLYRLVQRLTSPPPA